MKLSGLLLATISTSDGKQCPWKRIDPIANRIKKLVHKFDEHMHCFNNDMYGDGECFKSPALTGYSVSIPQITKEDCSTTCQVRLNTLYGIENGQKCYCGNFVGSFEPGTCDVACEGDLSELHCGGPDSTLVTTVQSKGNCFSAERNVLSGDPQEIPNLTQEECSTTCSTEGKKFYGLHGKFCSCGDFVRFAKPGTCDVACEGDRSENCGGINSIRVQSIDQFDEKFNSPLITCKEAISAEQLECSLDPTSKACRIAYVACKDACFFSPLTCPAPSFEN